MKLDKAKLAHDWYMKNGRETRYLESDVSYAWDYADAMQAEADKRSESGVPEVILHNGLSNLAIEQLLDLKETVKKIVDSKCDHEWDHISAYGGEGNYFVCPCGSTKEGK